jgi:endogenous inhibitor of DNA gyrase (YacG/DUF329 family)
MIQVRCPICGQPAIPRQPGFPFCGPRCRQVDLGRWLGEHYRIPAQADGEEEEPAEEPTELP